MKLLLAFFWHMLMIFGAFAQAPKILSFFPTSGNAGSLATITGTNFSPVASNNIVFFGSVRAQVNAASANSITITIPNGASYQPFTVTSNGLTAYSAVPFNLTYPTELVLSRSSFILKDSLPSGQGPIRIITCDLNNDGKPDLATINDTSNTVSIFRNNSTINNLSFASKIDIATGNRPRGIAIGDMDGDGNPDIIVANANSNTLSVYRNTSIVQGAIFFASKLDFNTNSDPRGVIITDIDNDGKPDIVTQTYSGGTISILRNTSNGANISFAGRVDFEVKWSSTTLVAADFNQDGKIDLAVPNGDYGYPLAFLKNTSTPGAVSFDPLKMGPYVSNSNSVSAILINGDIDNDGKPDIVSSGSSPYAFQNTSTVGGEIIFKLSQALSFSTNLPGIAMANFDNDASADIVSSSEQYEGSILIKLNTSTGGDASFDYNSTFYNSLLKHTSIAAADFDADGRIDVATANWYSRSIAVFKNLAADVGLYGFVGGSSSSSTGDLISLHGVNLTKVEKVSFGGSLADSFQILDSSRILAFVGAGSTGNVTVNSATGSASLPGFIFVPPPTFTDFTPKIAGAGDTITIKGTKFGATHAVLFGNIPAASFTIVNDSTILAIVDSGNSGNVIVRTEKGLALKSGFVFVHAPVIYSFTPHDAFPGNTIIIKGHSFSDATKLLIANEAVQSFVVISDSTISATIETFTGGKISITSPFGTGEIDDFYNGPAISSIDIYTANANTVITIQGSNFGNNDAENVVRFGDAIATVVSATNNLIVAKVPVGSTFGPITVTTHNLTTVSKKSFLQTFNAPAANFFANSFLPKKKIHSTYNSMAGPDASDLDGDGKVDFIVSATSAGEILIHKNNSSAQHISFTTSALKTRQDYLSYPNEFINDLNGDGKPEILATSYGDVLIYENASLKGKISFLPFIKFPFITTAANTEIADLDGNGKPEIIYSDFRGFTFLENTSSPALISFKQSSLYYSFFFQDYSIKCMSTGDFNGDGKPDIVISYNHGLSHVYKNISKAGNIQFEYEPLIIWNQHSLTKQRTCDIDGDGKEDIVGTTETEKMVVYRNTSNSEKISFSTAEIFNGSPYFTDFAIGDFDGNGKPDVAEVTNYSNVLSIMLNQSSKGAISFRDPIKIDLPQGAYSVAIGDFDADEKPDIAVIETNVNFISIFRNRFGEILPIEVCPPLGNSKIYASVKGSTYQWQVDDGSGFVAISDNSNYSGTTSDTLHLSNIPSYCNGWNIRCVVDNKPIESFQLAFTDSWTGIMDNDWENAANWNCGAIPDQHTHVIINSGDIIINQSTVIKSLTVNPNVNIQVKPGVHLTILQ
ncbi:MAG: FG-GAP-like repeat-containing protein [Bacteroidota bacterium]